MTKQVFVEGVLPRERLPADTTGIWSLSCVDKHVDVEVSTLREKLAADTTGIRSVPCVCTHVCG